MKVKVVLSVKDEQVIEDVITIDERNFEPLTEDEIESAIEVHISEWANNAVKIAWEVVQDDQS